jgi:hypothetical protein
MEGDVVVPILRTSERRDLGRCPQRWWWAWREGLRERGAEADALWFGSGIHEALAAWYCGPGTKRGPHPAETWQKWADEDMRSIRTVEKWDEEREAVWVDAKKLGTVMMEGYVKLYGEDEHKLVLSPEMTFSLDVPWPKDQMLYEETPEGLLLRYVGTFDSVWRHADTGHIWLDEHKTAGQIATGHLTLDPQAGSYWAVAGRYLRDAGKIGPNEQLWGIEYNFMRKALPDDRPKDAEGFATNKPIKAHYAEQLSTWLVETPEGRARSPITSSALAKMKLEQLQGLASGWGVTVIGERSKTQPAENFLRYPVHRTRPERNQQLIRLQKEGLLMQAYRSGILPVTKVPDRTCNQGAFRCPFFEMCELDEAGGSEAVEDFKQAAFVVRDPYADHR